MTTPQVKASPILVAQAHDPPTANSRAFWPGGLPASTIVSSEDLYDAIAASSHIVNGHVKINEDEVITKRPGSLGLYRSRDGAQTGAEETPYRLTRVATPPAASDAVRKIVPEADAEADDLKDHYLRIRAELFGKKEEAVADPPARQISFRPSGLLEHHAAASSAEVRQLDLSTPHAADERRPPPQPAAMLRRSSSGGGSSGGKQRAVRSASEQSASGAPTPPMTWMGSLRSGVSVEDVVRAHAPVPATATRAAAGSSAAAPPLPLYQRSSTCTTSSSSIPPHRRLASSASAFSVLSDADAAGASCVVDPAAEGLGGACGGAMASTAEPPPLVPLPSATYTGERLQVDSLLGSPGRSLAARMLKQARSSADVASHEALAAAPGAPRDRIAHVDLAAPGVVAAAAVGDGLPDGADAHAPSSRRRTEMGKELATQRQLAQRLAWTRKFAEEEPRNLPSQVARGRISSSSSSSLCAGGYSAAASSSAAAVAGAVDPPPPSLPRRPSAAATAAAGRAREREAKAQAKAAAKAEAARTMAKPGKPGTAAARDEDMGGSRSAAESVGRMHWDDDVRDVKRLAAAARGDSAVYGGESFVAAGGIDGGSYDDEELELSPPMWTPHEQRALNEIDDRARYSDMLDRFEAFASTRRASAGSSHNTSPLGSGAAPPPPLLARSSSSRSSAAMGSYMDGGGRGAAAGPPPLGSTRSTSSLSSVSVAAMSVAKGHSQMRRAERSPDGRRVRS